MQFYFILLWHGTAATTLGDEFVELFCTLKVFSNFGVFNQNLEKSFNILKSP